MFDAFPSIYQFYFAVYNPEGQSLHQHSLCVPKNYRQHCSCPHSAGDRVTVLSFLLRLHPWWIFLLTSWLCSFLLSH